ncbi:MAG: EF-hand domain-containing protein [Betaproteobacteria bacterium]
MRSIKPIIFGVSLFAIAAFPAYADAQKSGAGGTSASTTAAKKEAFSKLDKDGDGTINRIEAAADADAKSRFEQLDANKDGRLSRSEYEAWSKSAPAAGSPASGSGKK